MPTGCPVPGSLLGISPGSAGWPYGVVPGSPAVGLGGPYGGALPPSPSRQGGSPVVGRAPGPVWVRPPQAGVCQPQGQQSPPQPLRPAQIVPSVAVSPLPPPEHFGIHLATPKQAPQGQERKSMLPFPPPEYFGIRLRAPR
jgi:hypothetical protein